MALPRLSITLRIRSRMDSDKSQEQVDRFYAMELFKH